MSDLYVARLVQYGIESGLIPEEERIYSTNQILEVMKKDDYEAPTAEEVGTEIDLADTLGHLLDEALEVQRVLGRPQKHLLLLCTQHSGT